MPMEVVSKGMIERWILPHLITGKRGPKACADLCLIMQVIFYRLKTGCQWRSLPMGQWHLADQLSWQGVYYHYRRWVNQGVFRKAWIAILRQNKRKLDLSTLQLDGSHTPAKKGGEAVAYQGRKKGRTTNALFFVDNSGQPLALSTPLAGNHTDLFEIKILFEELCALLEEAGIDLRGVFLNADCGFDSADMLEACENREIQANINKQQRKTRPENRNIDYRYFDEVLYKQRFVVERANAWLDGYKALLVRYEKKISTWMAQHFMAFIALFLKKLNTC